MRTRNFIVSVFILFGCTQLFGQELRKEVCVGFRVGVGTLDTTYAENAVRLSEIVSFLETIQNLPRIVKEIYRFIGEYQDDLNGVRPLHPREWQRRYGRSSLPYFNSLLQQPRP